MTKSDFCVPRCSAFAGSKRQSSALQRLHREPGCGFRAVVRLVQRPSIHELLGGFGPLEDFLDSHVVAVGCFFAYPVFQE